MTMVTKGKEGPLGDAGRLDFTAWWLLAAWRAHAGKEGHCSSLRERER